MAEDIESVKCLIIGSGPAGYTAAIYAARANMKPVLYQGSQPGGQLTTTNEVENFPGVVIVGAGDSACEGAHYLSKLCKKVTMLVRRDEFRASKIMEARVRNTENIEILFNTETDEVLGDGQVVNGVRVFNNKTKEKHDIPATGFFVAIGHKPNTDIFKDYLDLDETGYIINVPGSSKTNIDGVFVSGDAADHVYRHINIQLKINKVKRPKCNSFGVLIFVSLYALFLFHIFFLKY